MVIKVKKLFGINKFVGLMFSDLSEPIYFETHFGIHTFFVKKPIDVLVLDKDFIVRKFANVKPNRIFFWSPKYIRVIEVQSGFIQKHKIKPGDKITIK